VLGNGISIGEPAGPVPVDRVEHIIYAKRPFTAIGDTSHELEEDTQGRVFGEREMGRLYDAVVERADVKSAGESDLRPVDLAVEAIADLRAGGREPDVVLIPHDVYLRALLSSHPDWSWAGTGLAGGPPYLATLAGVPVFDVAPREEAWLVVAHLASVVQRVERRAVGDDFPLSVTVTPISTAIAAQLMAQLGNETDSSLEEVRERYVEARLALDVEYRDPPNKRKGALRIELPPFGERRRSVRVAG
jgi:hypothetical protein